MSGHSDHNGTKVLALTPREQTRLAAILARLASPYEGERAAAGLLASAFVSKHNLVWADLTTLLRPPHTPLAVSDGTPPTHDRRSSGSWHWQGYCRRRLTLSGQALNRCA